MSSRFLYISVNSYRVSSLNSSPLCRQFASSSKETLDKAGPPFRKEPPLITFDAPSRPSEQTRRSARSQYSLTDYFSARRQVGVPLGGQVRSSTSSSSNFPESMTSSSFSQPASIKAEMFDRPSRPRAYYARPQRKQDLPEIKSRFTLVAALLTVAGLSAWGGFILYATNMERVSSSVVRQLATNLKNMEVIKDALGDNVHLEGKWWLGGEPWIDGGINLLQGNVDVSFRVKGSKGGGTVYFTSVREEKGQPFTILRHKIICDDGQTLRLKDIRQ